MHSDLKLNELGTILRRSYLFVNFLPLRDANWSRGARALAPALESLGKL